MKRSQPVKPLAVGSFPTRQIRIAATVSRDITLRYEAQPDVLTRLHDVKIDMVGGPQRHATENDAVRLHASVFRRMELLFKAAGSAEQAGAARKIAETKESERDYLLFLIRNSSVV